MKNTIMENFDFREFVSAIVADEVEKALNAERTKKEETKLLSADEVAKFFGVSMVTLWRWEKAKYLTPTKIGKKRMYRADVVNELIEK